MSISSGGADVRSCLISIGYDCVSVASGEALLCVPAALAVAAVGAGLDVTCLDEEAAALLLVATQRPMTTQVMMGITTKSTKAATDPPTAAPTRLLTTAGAPRV